MEENFEEGCILLTRTLKDSKVFQNDKWLKVWIWCLLTANHKTQNVPVKTGKGLTVVIVERGQFIYGRKSASRKLKMKESTVRNIMQKLETLGNIDIKEDTHYSIVTIRNYNKYQDIENYRRTGKRTPKGQAKDTNNNDKNINKEPEAALGSLDTYKDEVPKELIKEIAVQIDILKVKGKDRGFNPWVFVQWCNKAEMPAELTNHVLGELVKHWKTIDNPWGYANKILKREEGNYHYAKQLEKHYAMKKDEMLSAKDILGE